MLDEAAIETGVCVAGDGWLNLISGSERTPLSGWLDSRPSAERPNRSAAATRFRISLKLLSSEPAATWVIMLMSNASGPRPACSNAVRAAVTQFAVTSHEKATKLNSPA